MRIACLHTAESNVARLDAALEALGASATLIHAVRPDLLARAEAAGGLTDDVAAETARVLDALSLEADAALLTCSTLGPAATGFVRPVVRVDAALADAAAAHGGRVVALCAVETTLGPTRALFEEAAARTGAAVDVALVPGAWERFRAGDQAGYLRLIADAADAALEAGADIAALAQVSMAGAETLTRSRKPVLSSPAIGLRAAIDAAPR